VAGIGGDMPKVPAAIFVLSWAGDRGITAPEVQWLRMDIFLRN
jgi:hypothetical protein